MLQSRRLQHGVATCVRHHGAPQGPAAIAAAGRGRRRAAPAVRVAAGGEAASRQQQQQQLQLNVVITGASKGFGFAMAQQHLAAGDSVVICARGGARLEAALRHLRQQGGLRPGQVAGVQCDVCNAADVDRLAAFAADALGGRVDRWINNAGQVTRKRLLPDLDPSEIESAVGANVLGSLLCCRAAVRLMREHHERKHAANSGGGGGGSGGGGGEQRRQQPQQPQYHIFNLGFSKWGASFSKSACTHKATKMALTQLTESLSEELHDAGLGYIGVHNLSPGMVLTDLLLRDAPAPARRFFNALAEEPETVAAALVPRVRAVSGTRTSVDYLTPASALARVVGSLPQIFNGGRHFDKDGRRPGEDGGGGGAQGRRYNSAGVRLLYDFDASEY